MLKSLGIAPVLACLAAASATAGPMRFATGPDPASVGSGTTLGAGRAEAAGVDAIAADKAGAAAPLPDFKPLVAATTARGYRIDPAKGYAVAAVKPGVFLVTDGGYQAMFVPTGQGVVLFDAPPSMAKHLLQAIAETTREKLTVLVYSHAHVDHIAGAGMLKQEVPGLRIVAEKGTADFLKEMADPDRPLPTQVFDRHEVLKVGSLTADLDVGHWHSPSGDLFINLPQKRVVMAVDAFSAGSVPFMGLDLTQDMNEYLKVFDRILRTDWDVMVPGHHNNAADRRDVAQVRAYVHDVYDTAARIERAGDPALVSRAVAKYGKENSYAVARVLIDSEVERCAKEVEARWDGKLDDVDAWAPSQCRTALVYAEWDVGPHGHPA